MYRLKSGSMYRTVWPYLQCVSFCSPEDEQRYEQTGNDSHQTIAEKDKTNRRNTADGFV